MSNLIIRPISAAATRPLRSQILRPFQTPEELVFKGDEAADSLHAGVFLENQLVGIASVSRDACPGNETAAAWKLRGMAIKPELQGRGYGRALLEHCIAHVRDRGGQLLWCSGRTSALGFYRSLGFEASGEEYQVAGTAAHYRMVLAIPPTAE